MIIHDLTILMDTREQDKHIKKELEEQGYSVKKQMLSYADYSFIHNEKNYSRKFVVERKKNFDEIIGNINGEKTSRFYKEFERARKDRAEIVIIIEQTKYDLINKKYRSSFSPKEVYEMIQTFTNKYMAKCYFMRRDEITNFMLKLISEKINK